MRRLIIQILLVAAIASPAAAQSNVSPLPTQPNFGGLPAPAPPPSVSAGRVYSLRGGRVVNVPGNRSDRNNFSDRIETCIQAGSASGLSGNRLTRFSTHCAN